MPYRYSVILGNLGNTRDRFCSGYKDNPDTLAMLRRAAGIAHVEGIELVGSWDVTTASAADMARALADLGKTCVSIIPDLFGNPLYGRGSFSAPDPKARRQAIDDTLRMCEAAHTLGCGLLNLWPGQDGFDYLLTCDYDSARNRFRDAVAEVAQAHPDLRFALEYKPKEPRCFSLAARMADTLLLCGETGQPNVGVCIDTGHAFAAGENVAESIVLARRAGGAAGTRLFHMHFNDNHGAWDDDMMVASVHTTAYVEALYWLRRTGYAGWLSMDQYPYREDAAGAIGESIQWLKGFERTVERCAPELDRLVAGGDAVATSQFLRSVLLPGT